MFILLALCSFLLLTTLVVAIHEYGHYSVARLCGVKVLRFSIGFGPPLWRRIAKNGMEFRIGSLPLGGYVKMLDEREGPVPAAERPYAFNQQSIPRRLAVLAAGPGANFLFAIFLYWVIAVVGVTHVKPIIGTVVPHSIAAKSGLQSGQIIKQVEHKAAVSWQTLHLALLSRVGDKNKQLAMSVSQYAEGTEGKKVIPVLLDLHGWVVNRERPALLESIGIVPYRPSIPPVIAQVVPGGPADLGGLEAGDQLMEVNGGALKDWRELLHAVKKKPGERVTFLVKNAAGKAHTRSVLLGERTAGSGAMTGYLGVQSATVVWPQWALYTERYSPLNALSYAMQKTAHTIKLNLMMLYKMLLGRISTQGLSGPIGIAHWAGESMAMGWLAFASFMALVNVSLGVLNLLPIPLLDGGHMAFCFIEAVRGKPLSSTVENLSFRVGLGLLVIVMVIALWNDLLRL